MKLKLLAIVFVTSLSFAQTKEDVAKIIKNYDLTKIKERINFFEKVEMKEKEIAVKKANQMGWPIYIYGEDGSFQELMKLSFDGSPIYYSTANANAAKSTRAVHLNSGGTLGLNLNGQGMVARVWDGGTVRRTHTLFEGRVTTVDDPAGTTYSSHGTHVTGTILASNSSATAQGMAYQATARTFNWTNDESEATSEVLGGMLISNHSYGVPITADSGSILPAWYIGAYTDAARNWDEIAFLAPYYLPVMSAGNEGNNNDNANPIAAGFDKLTGDKTAKNTLIVANAQDANVTADGTLISVLINSSSSQGPTDDRRIKPDITGNGTSLTSTISSSDTALGVSTGTSMSSPNVAGTLLLLQQHYKNVTNNFMKAATLKGLACHTADDAGNVGPDAKFGWGLLNAKKAAQTISNNGLDSWISEENLSQGETFTMSFVSEGGANNPLIASITWTDVPGVAKTNTVENEATAALINNLDIKITRNGTTYYPWRLQADPNTSATRTDDNNVDNVEQVKIDNPSAGEYLITITHKGTLINGSQDFSLVVTGVKSDFSLVSKSDDLIVCNNGTATYLFDYKQTGSGTTSFSATGLPSGANAVFTPSSLSANGTVTMTITGFTNAQPGNYDVGIIGDNGTETETRLKKLFVYSNVIQPTVLVSPANNLNPVSTSINLDWSQNSNEESYHVQVATDANFNNIVVDQNGVLETNYYVTNLQEGTNYYWRVIPSNRCATAMASNATVYTFKTGIITCGYEFSAVNFTNATIASTANSTASVPIMVSGGLTIADINVAIDISHTYIQDMTYYLIGPSSIGSPTIKLFDQPCGDNDDIICTLDDDGTQFFCEPFSPAISGIVKPNEPLSAFNGMLADGRWTLRVEDPFNGDGGSINSVTIYICGIEQSLKSNSNELADFVNVYPNPAKDNLTITLSNNVTGLTSYALVDMQGRIIQKEQSSEANVNLNIASLVEGVYLLSIENGAGKTTKKVVVKR
ncbi:S8 family serine peptidase [Flavobacterium sp. NRK F7]|uniref:S8 family serine peptidase n=1 Tax=Flavobacterium sp. NRK F7 TaxID=2954930 RepID=UPI00209095E9|nr:S8 family serine peptidase [Flavobacterium sp. NRK F7]MCO6161961.1 S8 family serine peptidase [Flavobacterium sp. NRK F7]